MLNELREVFKSNIKALEILCVLEGAKPAARIMVKEEEKERVCSFFRENGLCYVVSDFKVVKQDKDRDYSDKGIRVRMDSGEKGHLFVYVSKDWEAAKKAKSLEEENNHYELGILLGYPRCCCEFFKENFKEQSKKSNDYTLLSLKNSKGFSFPFYVNIAARHFDLALIFHFPCSFNCESSIELAKKHLMVLRKHEERLAEIAEGMLKGAVLYTDSSGVFLLRYPKLEGNRLYYKGIMGTENNEMALLLKNALHIQIHNKSLIEVGDLEIKKIGVMLFGEV